MHFYNKIGSNLQRNMNLRTSYKNVLFEYDRSTVTVKKKFTQSKFCLKNFAFYDIMAAIFWSGNIKKIH